MYNTPAILAWIVLTASSPADQVPSLDGAAMAKRVIASRECKTESLTSRDGTEGMRQSCSYSYRGVELIVHLPSKWSDAWVEVTAVPRTERGVGGVSVTFESDRGGPCRVAVAETSTDKQGFLRLPIVVYISSKNGQVFSAEKVSRCE